MFFFSFFWAFFHSSLAPSIEIGCIWPPIGVSPISPFGLPLMNTVILLVSGASLTCVHNYVIEGKSLKISFLFMGLTIMLGILFTFVQIFEYYDTSFNISGSCYGSAFFILTGFHGLHVLVGTIMLIVSFLRLKKNHFTPHHHLGLESAIWYWHFVDVV
jgi:cytochrome c oxidase subunit 3